MPLLVLSAKDVSRVTSQLSPNTLASLMAQVFVRLHLRDRIEQPHRTSVKTGAYSALFMPAHVDGFGTTIKTVSVPNPGVPAGVQATTLVLDDRSGAAKAVVNATSLTALRTAAGSVLATRLLGPQSPRTLLVFGAGRQIEAHVELLVRSFPSLEHCIIVNRSQNSRLEALQRVLQSQFPNVTFSSEVLDSSELASKVTSADIICTATSSTVPLFKSSWVKSGTHINLVGSYTPDMAEVEDELVRRAGKILVDSREACFAEAGEIISAGVAPGSLIEVGEAVELDGTPEEDVVLKVKEAGDITIFKSVGVGLQDTVITTTVLDKAISMGIGTEISGYDRLEGPY